MGINREIGVVLQAWATVRWVWREIGMAAKFGGQKRVMMNEGGRAGWISIHLWVIGKRAYVEKIARDTMETSARGPMSRVRKDGRMGGMADFRVLSMQARGGAKDILDGTRGIRGGTTEGPGPCHATIPEREQAKTETALEIKESPSEGTELCWRRVKSTGEDVIRRRMDEIHGVVVLRNGDAVVATLEIDIVPPASTAVRGTGEVIRGMVQRSFERAKWRAAGITIPLEMIESGGKAKAIYGVRANSARRKADGTGDKTEIPLRINDTDHGVQAVTGAGAGAKLGIGLIAIVRKNNIWTRRRDKKLTSPLRDGLILISSRWCPRTSLMKLCMTESMFPDMMTFWTDFHTYAGRWESVAVWMAACVL
jgi:hypothetical protein